MSDEQAIKQTVVDYFESWVDADAARMEGALHPRLAKRAPQPDGTLHEDTAVTMIELTAAGAGRERDLGDKGLGLEVEVIEVCGSIATAVAHSNVYREYLHLVRADGEWRIVNALWDFER
jgi:hypothetical protein